MAMEIEYKFLVADDGWRVDADAGVSLRQGYLGGDEALSIRVRTSGEHAWLNVKHGLSYTVRHEFEYPIPMEDAGYMLENVCGALVEKTRYEVRHAGHLWEIDEFRGDNEGLILAEIELARVDERFERPAWVGANVSDDPRYLNQNLARHPFRRWTQG